MTHAVTAAAHACWCQTASFRADTRINSEVFSRDLLVVQNAVPMNVGASASFRADTRINSAVFSRPSSECCSSP